MSGHSVPKCIFLILLAFTAESI